MINAERPPLAHCHTEPAPSKSCFNDAHRNQEFTKRISSDTAVNKFNSPGSSRRNSSSSQRPSVPSSTTSINLTLDTPLEKKLSGRSIPSILSRLRSSISTGEKSTIGSKRPTVRPSDFRQVPEQPEKLYIDSIGIVIPGVCSREPCAHPRAHFVTNWRLCEPFEYTTALADHGITFSDHTMLLTALKNFLDEIPNETHYDRNAKVTAYNLNMRNPSLAQVFQAPSYTVSESAHQYIGAAKQAASLEKLLKDISWNWQMRGLLVMVCISSYSLFTPNRISESIVQIIHISRRVSPSSAVSEPKTAARFSFIDPFLVENNDERSVAVPRHKLSEKSTPHVSPKASADVLHHYQTHQLRDRTRPWPLWPNAIPSRKRDLMSDHADRYGVDPYFRAWMRANINSRTTSTSYAKYMIEKEDNPFINKRLQYLTPTSRKALLWRTITIKPTKQWNERSSTKINRETYEHNRKLEVRKTVEHGSRLRLVRFGFRHPIYPPHTPEMEELGLTREVYRKIIRNIQDMRRSSKANAKACIPHVLASWHKIRQRSTEDALTKVSEYIRKINAADLRVVWTIEKIPSVYDKGLGRDMKEWEISAWNGEDPLDLLIQLEKWGIIEERLNIDDDE